MTQTCSFSFGAAALGALLAFPHLGFAMDTDVVHARMLSGARLETGQHLSGLELSLSKGWKTYWRAPGESGIAPMFDLSASQNLKSYAVEWPAPSLDVAFDMVTVVYKDYVVLPFILVPIDPSQPIDLRLSAEIGVCDTVCIPKTIEAAAVLSPQDRTLEAEIRAAQAAKPKNFASLPSTKGSCRITPNDNGVAITLSYSGVAHRGTTYATLESRDPSHYAYDVKLTQDSQNQITAQLASQTGGPVSLARDDLLFTLIDDTGAIELRGCWSSYN